jgi:hypothetical protein
MTGIRVSLQCSRDDASLRRGKLTLETEPGPVLRVPPGDEPLPIGVADLFDRSAELEIATTPDGSDRHPRRPRDEPVLGIERREAGELHDVVHAETSGRQRVGERRQRLQGVRGCDPSPGFPLRHAVADESQDAMSRAPVSLQDAVRSASAIKRKSPS